MALKTAVALESGGAQEKFVLYQVKDVNTDDTTDVSADFSKIKAIHAIAAGAADPSQATPTFDAATRIVTFAQAGWADETLFVLVVGNAA